MLVLVAAASAACPAAPEDLARDAKRIALEGGDGAALVRDTGCLTGPITATGATWLHRVAAVERFEAHDLEGALLHLRATPPGWEPRDEELRKLAAARASEGPGPTEPLDVPVGWRALVDGVQVSGRPTDRAAVFQWMGPHHSVAASAMLLPGDPVPRPPAGVGAGLEPVPDVPPWHSSPRARRTLVGGALAGVGAGLLVAGLGVRASLPDPATGPADPAYAASVRSKRTTANALGWAGQGVGLLGAGVVVVAQVRR